MAYRSSSQATVFSGTDLVFTKPTGTVSGDVLVMAIVIGGGSANGATITWPSGFTQIDSIFNSQRIAYATKACGGSEPATYTAVVSYSEVHAGALGCYSGRDTTGDAADTHSVNSGAPVGPPQTVTASTITPSVTGADLIYIGRFSGPLTAPTGYTLRQDADGSFGNRIALCDKQNVGTGATGSVVGTGSDASTSGWEAGLLALIPSTGGASINAQARRRILRLSGTGPY